MSRFVDVVNFNADASCLSAADWIDALRGGADSRLMRWLENYVAQNKPMVLGLTGATAADIAGLNTEAIDYINSHRDVFQVIARPFSHDAALLRGPTGFLANLHLGLLALRRLFGEVAPFYLPPEFMLTAEQTLLLGENGIELTFINGSRFLPSQAARIPTRPYRLRGVLGAELACVPMRGELTPAYLRALDAADAAPWNAALADAGDEVIVGWRDGESALLFPDGLERERRWLAGERCRREHLRREALGRPEPPEPGAYAVYPLHPFTAWVREFRVFGLVQRLAQVEQRILDLDAAGAALWLQCANSDVLSSVEKEPVAKRLAALDEPDAVFDHVFHRTERGFEGGECLVLLELLLAGRPTPHLERADQPHLVKLRQRTALLAELFQGRRLGELLPTSRIVGTDR